MLTKITKLAKNLIANIMNYSPLSSRGLGDGGCIADIEGIQDHENHQAHQQQNSQGFGKFCHFFSLPCRPDWCSRTVQTTRAVKLTLKLPFGQRLAVLGNFFSYHTLCEQTKNAIISCDSGLVFAGQGCTLIWWEPRGEHPHNI